MKCFHLPVPQPGNKHEVVHSVCRGSEDEAEFESHPRSSQWAVEEAGEGLHYLLPLKSKLGLVQQPAIQRPGGKLIE